MIHLTVSWLEHQGIDIYVCEAAVGHSFVVCYITVELESIRQLWYVIH